MRTAFAQPLRVARTVEMNNGCTIIPTLKSAKARLKMNILNTAWTCVKGILRNAVIMRTLPMIVATDETAFTAVSAKYKGSGTSGSR